MPIEVKTWAEEVLIVLNEFVIFDGDQESLEKIPGCIHFGEVDASQPLLLLMHPDANGTFLELMNRVRQTAGQLVLFLDVDGVNDLLRRIDSEGISGNLKGIIITQRSSPALIHGGSYEELAAILEIHFKADRYTIGGTELGLHDLVEEHPDGLLGCMKTLLELGKYLQGKVEVNPALTETTNIYGEGTVLSELTTDLAGEFKRRIRRLCPEINIL